MVEPRASERQPSCRLRDDDRRGARAGIDPTSRDSGTVGGKICESRETQSAELRFELKFYATGQSSLDGFWSSSVNQTQWRRNRCSLPRPVFHAKLNESR